MKYICSVCKGSNIQRKAWVDINTHKIIDWFDKDEHLYYCEDCGDIINKEPEKTY